MLPCTRVHHRGSAISRVTFATLAATIVAISPVHAQDFATFDSTGLRGSEGVAVRVSHPSTWKRVLPDDDMAVAEFRGTEGSLTGVLQIGRGHRRHDVQALCSPERARTMLQGIADREPGTRVTDVVARKHEGHAGFDIRYERKNADTFTLVRGVIVCLRDSRVVVSCAGEGATRAEAAGIEPVCRRVMQSVTIREE
jgi:hypothetical protein